MTEHPEPVVTDHRRAAWRKRLTFSRSTQTYLMFSVACLMFIGYFATRPQPTRRAAVAVPDLGLAGMGNTPRQARATTETLDERQDRAFALAEKALPTPAPAPAQASRGGRQAAAPAFSTPKRDESLYASSVVYSKRAGTDSATSRRSTTADRDAPARTDDPGLDEITRTVLAEMKAATPEQSRARTLDTTTKAAPDKPKWPHIVREGTVIDGTLVNHLEGSNEGPVNVLVSVPVYALDKTLVIPAGSRVLGEATEVTDLDAAKLAVGFHRVLLPDGRDISLDQFKGLSVDGQIDVTGSVNRHYLSTFGFAAVIGLIEGFSQWLGTVGAGDTVVIGSVGSSTSTAMSQTMSRMLNRKPTIHVKPGTRLKVYVTSDLSLPPYETRTQ